MTGRLTRGPSLVERAIEALRDEIRSGAWSVGERIPTEAELVATLGVGRNTVREAIRALVHAGLLETRQGDGTYVRATSDLAGAVRRRISRAELLEVLEVRRALEVEAARLAAQRRKPDDVERLRALLVERGVAWEAGDVERFVERDVALHRAIAAASGNPMLSELYEDFSAALPAAIRTSISTEAPERDELHLHDALVAAIADGDERRAQEATTQVLDALIADVLAGPVRR